MLDTVICIVAGSVWCQVTENAQTKKPVAKATVQIKDTGRATATDQEGRFTFKNLKPGQYTLLVQTETGATGERVIHVPPDYDVVIEAPSVTHQAAEEPVTEPAAPAPEAEEPADEPPAVVQVGVQSAEPAPPKAGRKRKQGSTTE